MGDPRAVNSLGYVTDDPHGVSDSNSNDPPTLFRRSIGSRRLVPKRVWATRGKHTQQPIHAALVNGTNRAGSIATRMNAAESVPIYRSRTANNASLESMTPRELMRHRNTMRREGKLTQNMNTRILKRLNARLEKNRADNIMSLQPPQEEAAAATPIRRRSITNMFTGIFEGGAQTLRRSRTRRARKLRR